MNKSINTHDIVIIGGGLAATFFALNCKRSNPDLKICIIENSEVFPMKIGESLVDMTALFVEKMGLSHLLQGHVKKSGIRFLFNESNSENPHDQCEFASPTFVGHIHSYHLNRQKFDQDLLDEVATLGVEILRPAKIIDLKASVFYNQIHVETAQDILKLSSKWVVDASGRARFVPKFLNWKDKKINLHTEAIMAHFTGIADQKIWDTSNNSFWDEYAISPRKFSTTHFMRENKWWWIIRLNDELTSIGVVLNSQAIQIENPVAFFQNELNTDPQMRQLVSGAKIGEIRHIEKLPYVSEQLYSKGIALIGESGAFIDPLISPGLELIGQQSLWLSQLICQNVHSDIWSDKNWKHYERQFMKSYECRLKIYESAYPLMGSFDIFSAWLMQGNVLYFGKLVFPSVMFSNRIRKPLQFNFLERLAFNYFRARYQGIYDKRKRNPNRKRPKGLIRYSGVRVPKDWRFPFIPLVLMGKALMAYLRIELKR